MDWLAIGCGYVAGLVSAIFFVYGFKTKQKHEDTGKILGKVKELEPYSNQSREAQIEQARAEVEDAVEAWEG